MRKQLLLLLGPSYAFCSYAQLNTCQESDSRLYSPVKVSESAVVNYTPHDDGDTDLNSSGDKRYHTITAADIVSSYTSFSSITNLSPLIMGSIDTQHKPQAKVWAYAGEWWCAVPVQGGTKIHRLDGTNWTAIATVQTSGGRADCWVVGNVVHILNFRGATTNHIRSFQYDPATNTYQPWSRRPAATTLALPSGVEAATLTVDGNGRMWVAADGTTDIRVWWSDAPYTSWSSPIVVASGVSTDDICAITKLPGKIGIFWSNQTTGLFGFKTHVDGANPAEWSADEKPASQSAIAGNNRMADDHMNLIVASDGTLYCAAKTSYNSAGLPRLILLIRRPNGSWDNLYPVTTDQINVAGTQAIALLNETQSKLKIVFTSATNGGEILYRETSTASISFGPTRTLIGGPGANYNFSSSTHQTYSNEIVVVATDQSVSPRTCVGVKAIDGTVVDGIAPTVSSVVRQSPTTQSTSVSSVTFGVTFSESVVNVDTADFSLALSGVTASLGTISGSGSSYSVTVNNISGTGTLGLNVKSGGIQDQAGNTLTQGYTSGLEAYNIVASDQTAPTVSAVVRQSPTMQSTSATSVTFGVTFSESVTGVDVSDFSLALSGVTATLGSISGSGSSYSVNVNSISGTGTLGLNVISGGIKDLADNTLTQGYTSGSEAYTIVATEPPPGNSPITSFVLVDAATEKDVFTITDGMTIDLSKLVNTKLNIRAHTTAAGIESVKFELSGRESKIATDNALPYALHGDDGAGNYYYGNWNPPPLGSYTLKATPYSADKATGTAGIPYTISFTFSNSTTGTASNHEQTGLGVLETQSSKSLNSKENIQAQVFPNPASGDVEINLMLKQDGSYTITIFDTKGVKLSDLGQGWASGGVQKKVKISGALLAHGLNLIRIQAGKESKILKLLKE